MLGALAGLLADPGSDLTAACAVAAVGVVVIALSTSASSGRRPSMCLAPSAVTRKAEGARLLTTRCCFKRASCSPLAVPQPSWPRTRASMEDQEVFSGSSFWWSS